VAEQELRETSPMSEGIDQELPNRSEANPPPSTKKPRLRRVALWVTVVIVGGAVAVWVLGFFLYATHGHDEFFDDRLAARAEPVCARAQEKLRTDESLPEDPTGEDRAQVVERTTEVFAQMRDELRQLQRPGTNESFDEWLRTLDEYVELGPRFAAALRTGNPDIYEPVGNEGDRPATLMNRIARANDMDDCVF